MKEKTYHRMTQRSPFRGFKLFKQKYLTDQRFYAFLAKLKLVREVKQFHTFPILNNDYINKVRLLEDKIFTDRGVFSTSFYCIGEKHISQWWYESIFKSHKKLFTVMDEESIYVKTEVRAQCEEFEVRLDPYNHIKVKKSSPYISVLKQPTFTDFITDIEETGNVVNVERKTINFLDTRFGAKVTLKVADNVKTEDVVKESVQTALVQVRNFIEGNSESINERLTGVKADGEFTAPDGQKLLLNCICPNCGTPVFKASADGYTAQCVVCGKDMLGSDITKVDPEHYKDIYDFNKEILYSILYK